MWRYSYQLNSYGNIQSNNPPAADVRKVFLQQTVQLIEAKMQHLEAILEHVAEAVVRHDLHEDAERLLLRHLWLWTQFDEADMNGMVSKICLIYFT